MRKKVLIIIFSLISGFLFIGTSCTSAFNTMVSTPEKLEEANSCNICNEDPFCKDCHCTVYSATNYAWENTEDFPTIDWDHSYPIIKFINDLTIWSADFAVNLQIGFEKTGFQPSFVISEAVIAAVNYAIKEVKNMLGEILIIYTPAILVSAFAKAIVYYLIKLCDGDNFSIMNSAIKSKQFINKQIFQYIQNSIINLGNLMSKIVKVTSKIDTLFIKGV